MADTKISALAAAAALGGIEALPGVQAGGTVRITPAQLAAFARANPAEAVAFATTPPLDGNTVMAQRTVSGVIAFTAPANPVLGAHCYVRLIADGANAPTFSGFAEHGFSAGYLNVAGAVNHVAFWYDGTVSYYAISQVANVSPFAASGAAVADAAPGRIVLTYPYALNGSSVPAASAFAIATSGAMVTAMGTVTVSGQTVTVPLSRAIAGGETLSVTYTPPGANPLIDYNGNAVLTSSRSVQNMVLPAGQQYLRLDMLDQVTETAHAGGGYDYVASAGGGYSDPPRAYATKAVPAGADGFFMLRFPAAGVQGIMFGVYEGAAPPASYSGLLASVYNGTGPYEFLGTARTGGSAGVVRAPANGDLFRIARAGGIVTCQLSTDTGATWTTLYTFAGTSSAALHPCLFFGGTGPSNQGQQLIGSTNVA